MLPGFIRGAVHQFAGCKENPIFDDFRSGRRVYVAYGLRAPTVPGAVSPYWPRPPAGSQLDWPDSLPGWAFARRIGSAPA